MHSLNLSHAQGHGTGGSDQPSDRSLERAGTVGRAGRRRGRGAGRASAAAVGRCGGRRRGRADRTSEHLGRRDGSCRSLGLGKVVRQGARHGRVHNAGHAVDAVLADGLRAVEDERLGVVEGDGEDVGLW